LFDEEYKYEFDRPQNPIEYKTRSVMFMYRTAYLRFDSIAYYKSQMSCVWVFFFLFFMRACVLCIFFCCVYLWVYACVRVCVCVYVSCCSYIRGCHVLGNRVKATRFTWLLGYKSKFLFFNTRRRNTTPPVYTNGQCSDIVPASRSGSVKAPNWWERGRTNAIGSRVHAVFVYHFRPCISTV